MNIRWRNIAAWLGAALIGSAVTLGALFSFRLLAFQTDFYKAIQAYQAIQDTYYKPVAASKLVDGAIRGLVSTLDDPYAEYLTGREAAEFSESVHGELEGIGADIRSDGEHIVVIAPVHGSPAAKAGLLPNDIILEADGQSLSGLSVDQAAERIRGPKGTAVSLLIRRSGVDQDFPVSVVRDVIPTETVIYTELPDDIAHIKITEFSIATADEFDQAVQQLKGNGAKGIILDLRQNSGGAITSAVAIASYFAGEGERVATLEYHDKSVEHVSDQPPLNLPMVVLVDEGSASSSEVLAGALRDTAGIPLIGQQTYGKGVAQRTLLFKDGSVLKYTVSEMITPGGFRFDGIGLTPDVEVALPVYVRYPVLQLSETYRLGDRSEEIGLAQKYLEALEFNPGRTDGVFDKQTEAALKNMQEKAMLDQTGELDELSAKAMNEMLRKLLTENDTQLQKGIEVLKERMGRS